MSYTSGESRHRTDLALGVLVLIGISIAWGPLLDLFNVARMPQPGDVPPGDYPVFWLAGREALAGHAAQLYDIQALADLLNEKLGPDFVSAHWLYPPHVLLFVAPPAAAPYAIAWLLFLGAGLAVFLWAVRASFPDTRRLLFLMLIAPPTLGCIISGQTGLLASGLLLGGILLRDRRPLLAGILIGALTFKPQLGLIIPFALLAEGRFKTIAAAAATAIGLAVLSLALMGWDVWQAYLTAILNGGQQEMLDDVARRHGPGLTSLYGLALSLGFGPSGAMIAQGAAAVLAVAVTLAIARSKASFTSKSIAYVALSYVISPYVMIYDFPALGAVAAAYALGTAGPVNHWERFVAWLAVLTPLLQLGYWLVPIPFGSVAVLAFAALAAWRCLSAISRPAMEHT